MKDETKSIKKAWQAIISNAIDLEKYEFIFDKDKKKSQTKTMLVKNYLNKGQ